MEYFNPWISLVASVGFVLCLTYASFDIVQNGTTNSDEVENRGKRQESRLTSFGNANRNLFMEEGMSLYKFGDNKVDLDVDGGTSAESLFSSRVGQFALDEKMDVNAQKAGLMIKTGQYYPFYGGLYKYTILDVNGLIRFGNMGHGIGNTFLFGKTSGWPENADAAFMAPYLCKQISTSGLKGPTGVPSGVYYRLMMRSTMVDVNANQNPNRRVQCPSGRYRHSRCGKRYDQMLDLIQEDLQQGIVGATAFRADMALVVTWNELLSAADRDASSRKAATYQLVWAANRDLSYAMINYGKLGFSAADVAGNTFTGRCQALFNGGNMTGSVMVSPTERYQNTPSLLAADSAVPHAARGRYLFRIDDVVRRGGCSNKTGGTYPLLIYPDIVNLVGEMTVDVNGMCMTGPRTEYALYITERPQGNCVRLNSAIARCSLPKVWNWGTKEVYFQLEGVGNSGEKAFVGYIYFVPPNLDPMALDIGNIYEWYENPIRSLQKTIKWYPRNFTDPRFKVQLEANSNPNFSPADVSMYATSLDLYVVGYAEPLDILAKKFIPKQTTLARLTTFNNRIQANVNNWMPNSEILNLETINVEWRISKEQIKNEIYNYRVGYLKLAATPTNNGDMEEPGLISPPISLHWLYTLNSVTGSSTLQTSEQRAVYVQDIAAQMCIDWYNEDGNMNSPIMDAENNASCPCKEKQAMLDYGRFMPHPRCSKQFRMLYCTSNLGSQNCYLSAQNVIKSSPDVGGGKSGTPYGQVCCYDNGGYLMHTSYQPVVQTMLDTPYSPGFPLRAFEFGTPPYNSQYRVPGLSTYHYDVMPYFYCCKWTKNHCQFFYWRRPSSGCQQYQPPAIGAVMGAGHFVTLGGRRFVFNAPGIYTLLTVPAFHPGDRQVNIQIRMERYPDRTVNRRNPNVGQADIVEPLQVAVVTGIALQEGDRDRVQVLARKDVRRRKYRTSVVVGGILRYFDNMWLQRYDGVTVYVNKVHQGQSDVYVVLEDSKVGVRIRESYGIDMSIRQDYIESLGFLDVQLSLPPEYQVQSNCANAGYNTPPLSNSGPNQQRPKVSGLLRPDPNDATCHDHQPIRILDEGTRDNYIRQYGVNPDPSSNFQTETLGQNVDNLFRIDDDTFGEAWSFEDLVSGDIYQPAAKYAFPTDPNSGWKFKGISESDFSSMLNCWKNAPATAINNTSPAALLASLNGRKKRSLTTNADRFANQRNPRGKGKQCPVSVNDVSTVCGQNVPCRWDYGTTNRRIIAEYTRKEYIEFTENRIEAIKNYNSCAAMNIEYPEYLTMSPAIGAKYLEGNQISYDCFHTHNLHGHDSYVCSKYWDGQFYRFEWTKGWQPWCRSQTMEDQMKLTTAILGTIGILLILAGIFLCCWCVKRKKREEAKGPAPPKSSQMKSPLAVLELEDKSLPYGITELRMPSNGQPIMHMNKALTTHDGSVHLAGNGIPIGVDSGSEESSKTLLEYDSMPVSRRSSASTTKYNNGRENGWVTKHQEPMQISGLQPVNRDTAV